MFIKRPNIIEDAEKTATKETMNKISEAKKAFFDESISDEKAEELRLIANKAIEEEGLPSGMGIVAR